MGYKVLVSILGLFGLLSFCSAGFIDYNLITVGGNGTYNLITGDCIYMSSNNMWITFYDGNNSITTDDGHVYCYENVGYAKNTSSNNRSFYKFNITSQFPTCQICEEQYTSEECQSEYSLMPISSCDSEYCEMNNLCEVIGGSGSSTLYINDIWHESAPFIYVNIPEEFAWDYTTGEQEFTINVSGYNTDSDYIAGIINTQKSKPTNDDLQNIFFGLVPLLFPGLVFFLFLYFAFKFIKKIF